MDKLLQNDFTKWFMFCVTKKFADFNGRAQRKEYWMFVLLVMIINILLGIIEGILGLGIPMGSGASIGILSSLFALAILVPGIAVAVRRLHDTGRSGWWALIVFVPFIGSLVLLYFFILDSTPGENKYGANPKGL